MSKYSSMEIVDRASLAKSAAANWKQMYSVEDRNDGSLAWNSPECGEIYGQLVALGPSPNPDDVDRVTGNAWTSVPFCDVCKQSKSSVISFGEQAVSVPFCACYECVRSAAILFGVA